MFHMFPIMGSSEFLSLRSTGLPFLQAYGLLSIQSCHGFYTPHTVPPTVALLLLSVPCFPAGS